MGVAAHGVAFAAHDEADLGVGFQLREPVHHLHAGGFQGAGEADIGFLIEAGAQFHHGGDGLAGLGGLDQGLDDRAVAAGAVEGLLDRHHGGVLGGLAEELHHDVEALERVVDDDVLGADGGEAITGEIADAFGEARGVGREEQVWPVVHDQLVDVGQAEDAFVDVDFLGGGVQLVDHQLAQIGGHGGVDGEVDGHAAAAALEGGFVGADEVFGLFLELHVGVADQAEHAFAGDLVAGEDAVQEQGDELFQHDEADEPAPIRQVGIGQADEAFDQGGQRHQGAHEAAILVARQAQHQHEAHVGDEREGVRRVDRQRGEHREDAFHEPGIEPEALAVAEAGGVAHDQAGLFQLAAQLLPDLELCGHQGFGACFHLHQLLGGGAAIGRGGGDAGLGLADEAGDADGVELIEVGGGDGDEAQPLQQGVAGVFRLLQHAVVEIEPGQLAVDEPVWVGGHRVCQGVWRRVGQRGGGAAGSQVVDIHRAAR